MKIAIPVQKDKRKVLMEGRWSLGLNYQIIQEMGHGSYGRVYEVIDTKNNTKVAIKKFIRALGHPQLAQYCQRELEILSRLSHPNIVKLHRVLHSTHSVYLVMDFMPLDLKKLIYSSTFLTHEQVRVLMYEVLVAVNYLHSAQIVHRDIKPGNILVNSDCTIKLCDFGLARSICGLKITGYDFDEIYRREFAETSARNLVTEVLGIPELEEDLDEHVLVNTKLSMPGHFDVSRKAKQTMQDAVEIPSEVAEEMSGARPKALPKTLSCGAMLDIQAKFEEVKAESSIPDKAKALRQVFLKNVRPDPLMEREMTSHVASRWYRAPEVILLEKVYCSPVDMWGVGCVFGELLQTIKGNRPLCSERFPLFPGTSCFPLSPQLKPEGGDDSQYLQQGEQIIMICKILGTPSEEEAGFIADRGAKQYLKLLPKNAGRPFKEAYPDCTEEEVDLLTQMLRFNPFMRITAKEALAHPYFKGVRCKKRETETSPIALSTKAPDSVSIENLRKFCEEMQKQH